MIRLRPTLASFAASARQAFFVFVVPVVLVAPVVAGMQQQPVFRARVDSVLLDVLATDRGGIVSTLTAQDFEVRDAGVVQTLTHVSNENAPLSVLLLLDTSGSLSPRELDHLRQGALEVARSLRPDDELRLLTFTHLVTLHGVVDTESLTRVFDRLEPVGETALHDALTTGFRLSDRQDSKRPVVIAFSDGGDTASWMSATNVDEAARMSWASFFAVTPRPTKDELLGDLTSLTGGTVLTLDSDFAKLPATFLQILERIRQRYLIGFSPTSNAPGWHELDVRVKRSGVKVAARRGYLRR